MTALGDFTSGDVLTAADMNAIGTWTAYTPTFYNMVAGNGTVDFKYAQINKVVHVWGRFILGSTSTVGTTGAAFFSVPVTGADTFSLLGQASYDDDNGGDYLGWVGYRNAGTAYLLAGTTSGTYVGRNLLNNIIPFTWATNDRIIVSLTYEAA